MRERSDISGLTKLVTMLHICIFVCVCVNFHDVKWRRVEREGVRTCKFYFGETVFACVPGNR